MLQSSLFKWIVQPPASQQCHLCAAHNTTPCFHLHLAIAGLCTVSVQAQPSSVCCTHPTGASSRQGTLTNTSSSPSRRASSQQAHEACAPGQHQHTATSSCCPLSDSSTQPPAATPGHCAAAACPLGPCLLSALPSGLTRLPGSWVVIEGLFTCCRVLRAVCVALLCAPAVLCRCLMLRCGTSGPLMWCASCGWETLIWALWATTCSARSGRQTGEAGRSGQGL